MLLGIFLLMLNNLITSKTRLRLLVKFFINVANEGYLRGLALEMQESTNAIRKELNNLTEAGYLIRKESKQKITYKANQHNPFFALLQQIVRKYVGLDTIIEMVLERMGSVHRVFIIERCISLHAVAALVLAFEHRTRHQHVVATAEKLLHCQLCAVVFARALVH